MDQAAVLEGFEMGAGKEEVSVGAGVELEIGLLGTEGMEGLEGFTEALLPAEATDEVVAVLLSYEVGGGEV